MDAPNLEDAVDRLRGEVQELKAQRLRDQRRASKLEEQVQALVLENQMMEEQLTNFQQKDEDMKSLQEEISTLEEIRFVISSLCEIPLKRLKTIYNLYFVFHTEVASFVENAPKKWTLEVHFMKVCNCWSNLVEGLRNMLTMRMLVSLIPLLVILNEHLFFSNCR